MLTRSRELVLALVAMVFITILYILMLEITRHAPAASSFYGHSMGILGFILMLMTELLYTLRKRSSNARLGKMSQWLEFHIFTGLVGPFLVLLHTSWKFNGLAGVLMLFTFMIVVSGIIGRYIYTSVPRTADGIELDLVELSGQIRETEEALHQLMPGSAGPQASAAVTPSSPAALIWGRFTWELQGSINGWLRQRRLNGEARRHAAQLDSLVRQRDRLKRQAASLASARRLLALWHAIHVPLGLTMFAMAFVHIIGAIYYAELLH